VDFAGPFPDAAIIVTGVEDPDARAHGANESLRLDELARVWRPRGSSSSGWGFSAARLAE
jgi:hypothetical protein